MCYELTSKACTRSSGKMSKLFDGNSSDSEVELKTDSEYAKNYNTWRQKEELHKLQMKYAGESSESSSSSDEDDEEVELDDKFEKDFFKTLSCLKNKDPRIYDKSYEFFDKSQEMGSASVKKKKKEQPVFVKDYERKLILEKGGILSDGENDEPQVKSSTYVEEQKQLKENLKDALQNVDDENEGAEWGGLFKARQKTAEENKQEDEDYMQWLAGQSEHLNDEGVKNDLKPLKDFWSNPKLDEGEKFLRDYILKKRFLGQEDKDYIPTYDEVVHDSDEGLSEDEKVVDTQEEFEHKYNFRFEEPDQDFIKRYPRTMENSLRQKDDKRKVKRVERKERKKLEKQEKMEEIKQLQTLKKQEIEEKIEKLKEITGNADVGFKMEDLEDDFDPEAHDKRMQALFNDEFYEGLEGEQKPEFPEIDEELELENWDRWHGNENKQTENDTEPHCEDEDFNMDADYDPANTQKELIENSRKKKKRKRKSKFAQAVSEPKPAFDPNDKTYQAYLDEYYKLDCEDIIGDVPCRFKYREVMPNSFGLSVEEILMAKDKELNRWCSLKKTIQYRPEHVEKYDVIAFDKKGKNVNLKMRYLPSLFTAENPEEAGPSTSTTTATTESIDENVTEQKLEENKEEADKAVNIVGDKFRKRNKMETDESENKDGIESKEKSDSNTPEVRKNKKKRNETVGKETDQGASNNNNDTSKQKKKNNVSNASKQNEEQVLVPNTSEIKKKKKRKTADLQSNDNTQIKRRKKETRINKKAKTNDIGISDARLAAYGFNPKKFKNKMKYRSLK